MTRTSNRDKADFVQTMKRRSGALDSAAAWESVRKSIAQHDAREDRWRRMFFVGLGVALLAGVGVSLYRIEHEPAPWVEQVSQECRDKGMQPHVYRDEQRRVLGVRCDRIAK